MKVCRNRGLFLDSSSEKTDNMRGLLSDFGIKLSKVEVDESRYFDRYKISLSRGSRFSKIESVLDDIGLTLRSVSKPKGELNMPNGSYDIIIQKKYIESPDMKSMISRIPSEMTIPVALGVDLAGNDIFFDLNEIPNLLVAGTTGSGKSVLLHNIILSLLKSGNTVFVVDPKLVEFSCYNKAGKSVFVGSTEEFFKKTIDFLSLEISKRFQIFGRLGCRNISDFNKKFSKSFQPIVLVIDEWADLAMKNNSYQSMLCKIAQIGRAAGISIVLATQRPSADIISGKIKANFPGRIALRVASSVDSRVIIDDVGAENLKNKGSGIFIGGDGVALRFRTGYIEDVENYIKEI